MWVKDVRAMDRTLASTWPKATNSPRAKNQTFTATPILARYLTPGRAAPNAD
jgi:hypothetical protein